MKSKNIKKYLVAGASIAVSAFPAIASAAGESVRQGLNRVNSGGLFTDFGIGTEAGPVSLIAAIIKIMLVLAGIVAVFFLIIGGYRYITAQGNAEQAEKGRSTVINAIIGIVIIIMSYVIVNVVVNLAGRGYA